VGNFCIWRDINYNGSRWQWVGDDPTWVDNGANDVDSSWYNHGTACAHCDIVSVYRDINYAGGITICLARGQAVPSRPAANNQGSSHRWRDC
jgi:hypothetical protein